MRVCVRARARARLFRSTGHLGGPSGGMHPEVRRENPGGFNFPRPDLTAAPTSPVPSFSQTYPNLGVQGAEQPAQGSGFQANHHESQAGVHARTDRRPIIDDKIASSDMMEYTGAKKNELFKTTTNYLISKALEMRHFLQWAESFQGHEIFDAHVRGLANAGVCSDHDPIPTIIRIVGASELLPPR